MQHWPEMEAWVLAWLPPDPQPYPAATAASSTAQEVESKSPRQVVASHFEAMRVRWAKAVEDQKQLQASQVGAGA